MQRKALSLIGAAGRRGALQSDLAQAVGSENRNFFYVVKVCLPGCLAGHLVESSVLAVLCRDGCCLASLSYCAHWHCAVKLALAALKQLLLKLALLCSLTQTRRPARPLQLLEQRGLVVKHPLAVKRQGVTSSNAAHVTTNLLHLTRFAPPNVPQGTRMTVSELARSPCTAVLDWRAALDAAQWLCCSNCGLPWRLSKP
jgi:hypothetical protein